MIALHAAFAIGAAILGAYILLTRKGTARHKAIGRVFGGLMLVVAASSIFIQEISPGHYSPIHLLIPLTIGSVIFGSWSIGQYRRTRRPAYRRAHAITMTMLYFGALVVAGLFTLAPGRLFHTLIFG